MVINSSTSSTSSQPKVGVSEIKRNATFVEGKGYVSNPTPSTSQKKESSSGQKETGLKSSDKLTATTYQVGSKTFVGYKNERTGEFIPTTTSREEAEDYRRFKSAMQSGSLVKSSGLQTRDIERVLSTPEVASALESERQTAIRRGIAEQKAKDEEYTEKQRILREKLTSNTSRASLTSAGEFGKNLYREAQQQESRRKALINIYGQDTGSLLSQADKETQVGILTGQLEVKQDKKYDIEAVAKPMSVFQKIKYGLSPKAAQEQMRQEFTEAKITTTSDIAVVPKGLSLEDVKKQSEKDAKALADYKNAEQRQIELSMKIKRYNELPVNQQDDKELEQLKEESKNIDILMRANPNVDVKQTATGETIYEYQSKAPSILGGRTQRVEQTGIKSDIDIKKEKLYKKFTEGSQFGKGFADVMKTQPTKEDIEEYSKLGVFGKSERLRGQAFGSVVAAVGLGSKEAEKKADITAGSFLIGASKETKEEVGGSILTGARFAAAGAGVGAGAKALAPKILGSRAGLGLTSIGTSRTGQAVIAGGSLAAQQLATQIPSYQISQAGLRGYELGGVGTGVLYGLGEAGKVTGEFVGVGKAIEGFTAGSTASISKTAKQLSEGKGLKYSVTESRGEVLNLPRGNRVVESEFIGKVGTAENLGLKPIDFTGRSVEKFKPTLVGEELSGVGTAQVTSGGRTTTYGLRTEIKPVEGMTLSRTEIKIPKTGETRYSLSQSVPVSEKEFVTRTATFDLQKGTISEVGGSKSIISEPKDVLNVNSQNLPIAGRDFVTSQRVVSKEFSVLPEADIKAFQRTKDIVPTGRTSGTTTNVEVPRPTPSTIARVDNVRLLSATASAGEDLTAGIAQAVKSTKSPTYIDLGEFGSVGSGGGQFTRARPAMFQPKTSSQIIQEEIMKSKPLSVGQKTRTPSFKQESVMAQQSKVSDLGIGKPQVQTFKPEITRGAGQRYSQDLQALSKNIRSAGQSLKPSLGSLAAQSNYQLNFQSQKLRSSQLPGQTQVQRFSTTTKQIQEQVPSVGFGEVSALDIGQAQESAQQQTITPMFVQSNIPAIKLPSGSITPIRGGFGFGLPKMSASGYSGYKPFSGSLKGLKKNPIGDISDFLSSLQF